MAIEAVKEYFSKFGIADKVQEFDVSSATVELAAEALSCELARIAKTLSFDLAGETILVVTAGDMRIAGPKFKAEFHSKPKMLEGSEVEQRIGHAVGGVCPFALKEGVKSIS